MCITFTKNCNKSLKGLMSNGWELILDKLYGNYAAINQI